MTLAWTNADIVFMRQALAISLPQAGRTGVNPAVGCVIVAQGVVVGQGATADGGRPHAEAIALAQAGDKALGACVYVTLEPCAHESPRGPTCAQILVSAGASRLVASLTDPDPRTSGQGFEMLRRGGVLVQVGLLENEARDQLNGFLSRFEADRQS